MKSGIPIVSTERKKNAFFVYRINFSHINLTIAIALYHLASSQVGGMAFAKRCSQKKKNNCKNSDHCIALFSVKIPKIPQADDTCPSGNTKLASATQLDFWKKMYTFSKL